MTPASAEGLAFSADFLLADHLATLLLDYEVQDGLTLSAAYRYGREGGEDNHTIGLLFAYEFSVGGR